MNRLQQKCFAASAGVHALLVLILFVGPAFLSSSPPKDTMPILDFVPFKTVDAMVSGGGNPNAKPVALPAVEPPKPLVQPSPPPPPESRPQPDPEPVKPVVQPKLDPDAVEVESRKRRPEINTKVVTRTDAKAEAAKKAAREAEARKAADARRRMASQILAGAERIGSSTASIDDIELKGPGGGGIPYANFLQAVKSRYARAWIVPDGVTDEDATTTASVTIARDGTVVSARITRHSRSVEVDRSVQRTLDEVKWAAPLPDDARENERTVEINFNVRAKRTSG
jgi:outer membrane biosynthesis protein TonB